MRRDEQRLITQMRFEMAAEARRRRARHVRRVANSTAAKPRPTCTCAAYPWPHRPGGGNCRFPDLPAKSWNGKAGKNPLPVLRRTSSVRRKLLKQHGLHPIRDRAKIRRWLPKLYAAYWRRLGWWIGPDTPAMRITNDTPVCFHRGRRCRGGRWWVKYGLPPPPWSQDVFWRMHDFYCNWPKREVSL
jgi:hypothetical protein